MEEAARRDARLELCYFSSVLPTVFLPLFQSQLLVRLIIKSTQSSRSEVEKIAPYHSPKHPPAVPVLHSYLQASIPFDERSEKIYDDRMEEKVRSATKSKPYWSVAGADSSWKEVGSEFVGGRARNRLSQPEAFQALLMAPLNILGNFTLPKHVRADPRFP